MSEELHYWDFWNPSYLDRTSIEGIRAQTYRNHEETYKRDRNLANLEGRRGRTRDNDKVIDGCLNNEETQHMRNILGWSPWMYNWDDMRRRDEG